MNIRLTATMAALALVFAVTACNKPSKLNTPSTASPPSGPAELKLKWTPGESIVQEFDMSQDMIMNIPSQPAPMDQQMNLGQKYFLKVLKTDADGGHEIEMEFKGVHVAMKTGDKVMMTYNSDTDSAASATNQMAKIFGKIVGAKVQYSLDTSNNVVRVEGINDLIKRLQTGDRASAAMIRSMFNENYFKQIMNYNRFLPPGPVQTGDTWPVKIDVPLSTLGTMSMGYTFTFKGWEMHGPRNCARIEFSGTIESQPGRNNGPMGMAMTIQNGTTTGVMWFDPEFGMVIDSNMQQDMTMLLTLPKNAQMQMGTSVLTNQLNQTINFKVDSLN